MRIQSLLTNSKVLFLTAVLLSVGVGCVEGGRLESESAPQAESQWSGKALSPSANCGSMSALECEMFQEVNSRRVQNGLAPLQPLSRCVKAARSHSVDMARSGFMSHDSPNSGGMVNRFNSFGVPPGFAENLAAGTKSPSAFVDAWLNSQGHRANILNSQYRSSGIGYASGGMFGHYWTQCFSGSGGDK